MSREIVIIKIGQLSEGDVSGDLSGIGFTRIGIDAADREGPVKSTEWSVKTQQC
jgi:hypothetical protein